VGEKLGTKGVLYSLVRTKVGPFLIEDSIKIEGF
jgi:tRNA U55 pseudouridine synthase TruB